MPRVILSPEKLNAAIRAIKKAILDIREWPESLFTEPRLARRLGFSRYLLRIAVMELAQEGAITMFPRKGFRINREKGHPRKEPFPVQGGFTWLESVYSRRLLLEGHVITKLAETKACKSGSWFNDSISAQQELIDRNDENGFYAYDLEFHANLFQAFGSASLLQKFKSVAEQLTAVWQDKGKEKRPVQDILREHADICFWIRQGDAAKALSTLRQHCSASHKCTRDAMTSGGRPCIGQAKPIFPAADTCSALWKRKAG